MDDCIIWPGPVDRNGYGKGSRGVLAHRLAYEKQEGAIPAGLELDHLCSNRACVNPAHLEPVTHAENVRRATENRTHCKRGHAYSPENTYSRPDGARQCRACNRAAVRRYKSRRAAA